MSKIILETRGLTKHYGGVHALDDANFILHEGEHVAVVGDNGAGKSTFVRQVTAVEQRTSGDVIFDSQPVQFSGPLEARQAGIETVFQTLALADDLDVPSNLFLGRELFKFKLGPFSWLDRKTMRDRTMEALATTAVKIPNVDNPIRNMSGGQRQCVSIARTAAFASKLVIMDEPTAALGVQETAQVENIIRGLKERGIPMILISHNLRQVFDLVDRIVVFRRGRIVASLRKDETDGNDIVHHRGQGRVRYGLCLTASGGCPADWAATVGALAVQSLNQPGRSHAVSRAKAFREMRHGGKTAGDRNLQQRQVGGAQEVATPVQPQPPIEVTRRRADRVAKQPLQVPTRIAGGGGQIVHRQRVLDVAVHQRDRRHQHRIAR